MLDNEKTASKLVCQPVGRSFGKSVVLLVGQHFLVRPRVSELAGATCSLDGEQAIEEKKLQKQHICYNFLCSDLQHALNWRCQCRLQDK